MYIFGNSNYFLCYNKHSGRGDILLICLIRRSAVGKYFTGGVSGKKWYFVEVEVVFRRI